MAAKISEKFPYRWINRQLANGLKTSTRIFSSSSGNLGFKILIPAVVMRSMLEAGVQLIYVCAVLIS